MVYDYDDILVYMYLNNNCWTWVDPLAEKYLSESGYSFSGNNAINFIDINGMAYYYASDGTYLGSDGEDNEDVYSVSNYRHDDKKNQNIFAKKDATQLKNNKGDSFTHSQFLDLAGTVMGEMDQTNYSKEEAQGIYSVIENRASALNTSELNIAENTGIYGWDIKDNIDDKAYAKKAKTAISGTMDAMNSKTDFSNGAYFWQGRDIRKSMEGSTAYESYYLTGLNFTNKSHDFWNLGSKQSGNSKYKYLYESTGFEGRTTFLRYTEEWKKYKGKTKNYR